MHKIEERLYGFKVTVSGIIEEAEAEEIGATLFALIGTRKTPFGLLIDCRNLVPLASAVAITIEEGYAACSQTGCKAVVAVINSPVIRGQLMQMSCSAASTDRDRVIDASKDLDWEKKAVLWLTDAIEPVRPQPSKQPQT